MFKSKPCCPTTFAKKEADREQLEHQDRCKVVILLIPDLTVVTAYERNFTSGDVRNLSMWEICAPAAAAKGTPVSRWQVADVVSGSGSGSGSFRSWQRFGHKCPWPAVVASHHFHSNDWLSRDGVALHVDLRFPLILNNHRLIIHMHALDGTAHLGFRKRSYWILKPGLKPGP